MQEGGIAKDPKRKNFEILLSPPWGGWEAEDKNVKKLNDFFSKIQSSITLFRSKIIKNGKKLSRDIGSPYFGLYLHFCTISFF